MGSVYRTSSNGTFIIGTRVPLTTSVVKSLKNTKDLSGVKVFSRKGWYTAGGKGSGFPYRSGTCPLCKKGVKEGEAVYAYKIELGTPLPQGKIIIQHKDCLEALVFGESPLAAHEKLVRKWEEGGKFFE